MIQNEVAILRRVKHPNIVLLIEEMDTYGELYLVMELVKVGARSFRNVSRGEIQSGFPPRRLNIKARREASVHNSRGVNAIHLFDEGMDEYA